MSCVCVISVCELSKEKPAAKWEIDADDGDKDFLCHTLFLKQVKIINYDQHQSCRYVLLLDRIALRT